MASGEWRGGWELAEKEGSGGEAPQRRRDGKGRSARWAAREGGSLRERLKNRRRIGGAGIEGQIYGP